MKNKIQNIAFLGIIMLSIAVTAESKNKYQDYLIAGRSNITKGYIGVTRAKSIALKKVPGAKDSDVREIHLDREDGREVYETEIYYNNLKYKFDIDATTGEIVKMKIKNKNRKREK